MEKLPKSGNHTYMSPDEIQQWYETLRAEYEKYNLSAFGVKFPKFNTAKALWLIYLRKHLGTLVHKDTISSFVQSVNPAAGKDQQVRHLAGDGWYVLNKGDEFVDSDETVPSGYHVLIMTKNPKPVFQLKATKRAGRLSARSFKELKITYDNRCATCGSQEGRPHLSERTTTELHQGHMDPSQKLTLENSIRQCQVCNQSYQDDFVFDVKGRVVAVASKRPVLRANPAVQSEIKKALSAS